MLQTRRLILDEDSILRGDVRELLRGIGYVVAVKQAMVWAPLPSPASYAPIWCSCYVAI